MNYYNKLSYQCISSKRKYLELVEELKNENYDRTTD